MLAWPAQSCLTFRLSVIREHASLSDSVSDKHVCRQIKVISLKWPLMHVGLAFAVHPLSVVSISALFIFKIVMLGG
jgi:hypothetical protein